MLAARVVVTQTLSGSAVASRLEDRGIRTFIPTYTREVSHARRTTLKTYPMFSRYLFAWLDEDQARLALDTRGCVDVLRRAGSNRMAVVSDAVLAGLGAPAPETFNIDDAVTVMRGQWKDLQGTVAALEERRVILLYSMLGAEMRLPIDACDLTHRFSP